MKLTLVLSLIGLSLLPLAACQATVQDKNTKITVSDPASPAKGPPHCPPGHAKKGWC